MSTNEPRAPVACTPQALSAEAWATHQTTSAQLFGARRAAAGTTSLSPGRGAGSHVIPG